jgi:hypothetical protein
MRAMAEQNFIPELRAAKAWVDAQSATLRELGLRLAAVEDAYRTRTGEFADLPRQRPEAVRKAIEAADDEPGRGLLDDLRSSRLA